MPKPRAAAAPHSETSRTAGPRQRRFIVAARLAAFRGAGGVRLEDDVVVLGEPAADGSGSHVENLSLCPRTVEEVKAALVVCCRCRVRIGVPPKKTWCILY